MLEVGELDVCRLEVRGRERRWLALLDWQPEHELLAAPCTCDERADIDQCQAYEAAALVVADRVAVGSDNPARRGRGAA